MCTPCISELCRATLREPDTQRHVADPVSVQHVPGSSPRRSLIEMQTAHTNKIDCDNNHVCERENYLGIIKGPRDHIFLFLILAFDFVNKSVFLLFREK